MCSIVGYCGPVADPEAIRRGFDRTRSRGPDDSRMVQAGEGLLGFHRLAIMGLTPEGMQPFELEGSLAVCNGEIYGFEKLKEELIGKGYTFRSGSDCEILLPLYREYGADMFAMLDAEFACILYDAGTGEFIAARDPIGIRPLYYGYDSAGTIIFASEPKNLLGLTDRIMPFPPGHYYRGGEFVCYRDIAGVDRACRDDLDTVCANIREKLVAGVEKRLVSDAIDLKYARQVADYIGSDHTEVIITKQDVLSALETVVELLGTYDITTIRASMGMYLICRAIHERTDVRVLLTGEISDELFGYKYTDFAPSAQAFQEEAEKRVRELHMYDVLRADRCVSVNSLEARVPFGDLDFVQYVMSIDPEKKLNAYGKGKYLLRRAFEGDWLPESILWREKAAFSDAVGHSLADDLKEYAEGRYTDGEFEARRRRYTHARPFTKESLLYREIFEKYYPGQSHMVADFWMPNRSWEGCDVNDPSARVLANYGDSGV